MVAKNKLLRKELLLGEKKLPLRRMFHGKEIREAAKILEDFRLKFNEEEILYGAKLTMRVELYEQGVYLQAKRMESDKEYQDRMEKERLADVRKAELALKRRAAAELKKSKQKEESKKLALEQIQKLVKSHGLTKKLLETLVDK